MKKEVERHLQTAKLLMDGVTESLNEWDAEYWKGRYYGCSPSPEDSKESVVRRLVQIRQELLQVMKELRGDR